MSFKTFHISRDLTGQFTVRESTYNEIKKLFPRASGAFLDVNPQLSHPITKQNTENALDTAAQGKGKGHDRVTVCVTSYRTRLLDLDNAHGGQKFLLDCVKELGLIYDDDPESIELIVRQQKVAHRHQEKTLLELTV